MLESFFWFVNLYQNTEQWQWNKSKEMETTEEKSGKEPKVFKVKKTTLEGRY